MTQLGAAVSLTSAETLADQYMGLDRQIVANLRSYFRNNLGEYKKQIFLSWANHNFCLSDQRGVSASTGPRQHQAAFAKTTICSLALEERMKRQIYKQR